MNVKINTFWQHNINNNNKRLFWHQSPRGEGHFTIPTIPFLLLSVVNLSARYSCYSRKKSSGCSWVVSPNMKKREKEKKRKKRKTIAFFPPAFHLQTWGNLFRCSLLWPLKIDKILTAQQQQQRYCDNNNNDNSNKRLFWRQSPMEKGLFKIPSIPFLLLSVFNLSARYSSYSWIQPFWQS